MPRIVPRMPPVAPTRAAGKAISANRSTIQTPGAGDRSCRRENIEQPKELVNDKSHVCRVCARRPRRLRGLRPDRPDRFGHAATLGRPAGSRHHAPLGAGDGAPGLAQEAASLGELADATTAPPAVSTSNADSKTAAAPVSGANSFTEGEARSRLEAHGYSNVTGLAKDNQSIWRGKAMKDGKPVDVALDYQGNIVAH